MTSLTYGNGLSLSRSYDLDYRLNGQAVNGLQNLGFGYDPAGNLQIVNNALNASQNRSFNYMRSIN